MLRGYQLPIIPDKRKKPDKFQRIESVAPLWERGFVFYDESQKDDPDMVRAVDFTLAFQKGMRGHDDAPTQTRELSICCKNIRASQVSRRLSANVGRLKI